MNEEKKCGLNQISNPVVESCCSVLITKYHFLTFFICKHSPRLFSRRRQTSFCTTSSSVASYTQSECARLACLQSTSVSCLSNVCNFTSSSEPLSRSIPQGSDFGPVLIALYLLPLGPIISTFKGVSSHCYTDDIQLHVSFKPHDICKISVLLNCITSIKTGWHTPFFS